MYAIKPWGNVSLIGCSVGSYAMGIGMRWRESNVTIIEKRPSPSYELKALRRCVITDQSLKLLTDIGCTEPKLRSVLTPAKGWRFISPQLETLRESSTFPGCAVGEVSYHCSEGDLLRVLRTEFLRFGGSISWGTEAFEPFESTDGTDTWCLRKQYGLTSNAEAIITTASGTSLEPLLFAKDPNRIAVLFHVGEGEIDLSLTERECLVGNELADTFIVVGDGIALHGWFPTETRCAWKLIFKGGKNSEKEIPSTWHDLLRKIVAIPAKAYSWPIPGTTPAIVDSAFHHKISVLGDGLLPVDPFEWRGDNARVMIEEASTLCRAFYGKKYHRGNVSFLLRDVEQDSLTKRSNLLRRDLIDAEHFLAIKPLLEDEPSEMNSKLE